MFLPLIHLFFLCNKVLHLIVHFILHSLKLSILCSLCFFFLLLIYIHCLVCIRLMLIMKHENCCISLELRLQLLNLIFHFQHFLFIVFNQFCLHYFVLLALTQNKIRVIKVKRIIQKLFSGHEWISLETTMILLYCFAKYIIRCKF